MRKDVAKKWVAALKSGKYKQGENFLLYFDGKNQPRHCCLGVLCELYNDAMKKNHKKPLDTKTKNNSGYWNKSTGKYNGYVTFNNKDGCLPNVVKNWAKMKHNDGSFKYTKTHDGWEYECSNSLADLNDGGETFKKIASIISKNVDNL